MSNGMTEVVPTLDPAEAGSPGGAPSASKDTASVMQGLASLVEEAEAKARAAQAEAEAKAAEASRLADTASTRRDALSSSQDELASRRAHADKLDPRVKSDGTRKDGETDLTAETAGDSAVDAPTHRDSTAR